MMLACAVVALAAGAAVQGDTASFVERARAGTQSLRTPDAARAAGYRPVGPDFPGMGRHWIHTALILRTAPNPAEPPILEFAEINGQTTLVGVAYAVLLKGDSTPSTLPVPPDSWHFHQGSVDEESFLRSHAGASHIVPGPRLAVMHAWIWLDNPDGMFATDNWALPYARFGLAFPPHGSRAAARALALAAGEGGRRYLEALLHAVGQPSEEEMKALAAAVGRHQMMASASRTDVVRLEGCWAELWNEIETNVRPEVWGRLAAIR